MVPNRQGFANFGVVSFELSGCLDLALGADRVSLGYRSYSLNSLKGGYIGDLIGDHYRGY